MSRETPFPAFRQLHDAGDGAFSYLLADPASGDAVIIDPAGGLADLLMALLHDLGAVLRAVLVTHLHEDGDTPLAPWRRRFGAVVTGAAAGRVDRVVRHEDRVAFGMQQVEVIATAGHTPCSVCYRWRDRVFTGDTLLIGGSGPTDLAGSDAGRLYDSVVQRLFVLPGETLVFPGRGNGGRTVSTITEEKACNPCFAGRSRDSFVTQRAGLNVPSAAFSSLAFTVLPGGTASES